MEIHFAFVGKSDREEIRCFYHEAVAGTRLDKINVPVSATKRSLGCFGGHFL